MINQQLNENKNWWKFFLFVSLSPPKNKMNVSEMLKVDTLKRGKKEITNKQKEMRHLDSKTNHRGHREAP